MSNHLTAAIIKYFGDSGRFQYAANLFEKITAKEPEVASLLAKSYLGMSECATVRILASLILTGATDDVRSCRPIPLDACNGDERTVLIPT